MRAVNPYVGPSAYERPVATTEQLDRIVDAVKRNGGHSENLPTGRVPEKGFMVSLAGTEQAIPAITFGFVPLHRYVVRNATLLRARGAYLGVWVDGHGEPNAQRTVYLDVSVRLDNRADAIELGRENSQKAIYDVAAGREITL